MKYTVLVAFVMFVACSDTDPVRGPSGGLKELSVTTITHNHGHEAVTLGSEAVENMQEGEYLLVSGAHMHSFYATEQNLRTLRDGKSVSFTANGKAGHAHTIVLKYALPEPVFEGDD